DRGLHESRTGHAAAAPGRGDHRAAGRGAPRPPGHLRPAVRAAAEFRHGRVRAAAPAGRNGVLRGQLEHLLVVGRKRNVEIQIAPLRCEESAGVDGPFTVVTRDDGRKFAYTEAQGTSTLQTDPQQTALAAARYGIIRSQALTPRESLEFIERLLGAL